MTFEWNTQGSAALRLGPVAQKEHYSGLGHISRLMCPESVTVAAAQMGGPAHLGSQRTEVGPGPHGNPVQFPHSHCIPAPIPSEVPRIDFSGMTLGQDEMDSAIQTTSP